MLQFRIVKRQTSTKLHSLFLFYMSMFVALVLAATVSCLFFYLQNIDISLAIKTLISEGYTGEYALPQALQKAIPIFLCALGVSIAFRMQIWNIGAEGQYAFGAMGATLAILLFPALPSYALIPLLLLFAAIAGALWAGFPAYLRLRFGMNEIVTTLMLNYIAIAFMGHLLSGIWKGENATNFTTDRFPSASRLPQLWSDILPGINGSIFICLFLAIAVILFFKYTRLGFELRIAGQNPNAAKYAGLPYSFLVMFVMMICGALAGIAGGLEASNARYLQTSIMVGYGYTAIVVAWLSRLNPATIAIFSFLIAGLRVGVEGLQLEFKGLSKSFGDILEGVLLISVLALQFFDTYTISIKQSQPRKNSLSNDSLPTDSLSNGSLPNDSSAKNYGTTNSATPPSLTSPPAYTDLPKREKL